MADRYQPTEWSGRGAILATWARDNDKRGHDALGDRGALPKRRKTAAERRAYLRAIGLIR
jgi:hypothetical protein